MDALIEVTVDSPVCELSSEVTESRIPKINACKNCGKTFDSDEVLKVHMNYICGQKNYRCQICRKPFGESEELNKHLKIVHNETLKKDKYKCHKAYVRQAGLKNHLLIDHEGLELKVKERKCVPCKKIFRYEDQINEHIRIDHEEKKDKNLTDNEISEPEQHVEILEESNNLSQSDEMIQENEGKTMDEVDVELNQKEVFTSGLVANEKGDNDEMRSVEINNGKTKVIAGSKNSNKELNDSNIESTISNIESNNSNAESDNTNETPKEDDSSDKAFGQVAGPKNLKKQCEFCKKIFKKKFNLGRHIKTVHEGLSLKLKTFDCRSCGKRFSDQQRRQDHEDVVHCGINKYKCDLCEKTFGRKISLRRHIAAFHEGKRYKCETCGKEFMMTSNLNKHIKTVHEGKRHTCEKCGKEFGYMGELKVHIHIVHEGQKDYKCKICSKSFSFSRSLKSHIFNVHKGQKDYQCETCGKYFNNRRDLKRHVHTVHEGRKDYKCETCGKEFGLLCNLKQHIKIHEGARNIHEDQKSYNKNNQMVEEKHYECELCGRNFKSEHDLKIHVKRSEPYALCVKAQKKLVDDNMIILNMKNIDDIKTDDEETLNESENEANEETNSIAENIDKEGVNNCRCDICGKEFRELWYLNLHVKIIHEGQKNLKRKILNILGNDGNITTQTETPLIDDKISNPEHEEFLEKSQSYEITQVEIMDEDIELDQNLVANEKIDNAVDQSLEIIVESNDLNIEPNTSYIESNDSDVESDHSKETRNQDDEKYVTSYMCHKIFRVDPINIEYALVLKRIINIDEAKHERNVHGGHRDFECEECDKEFGSKFAFFQHMKAVHFDKYAKIVQNEFQAAYKKQSKNMFENFNSKYDEKQSSLKQHNKYKNLKIILKRIDNKTNQFSLSNENINNSEKMYIDSEQNKNFQNVVTLVSCHYCDIKIAKSDIQAHKRETHEKIGDIDEKVNNPGDQAVKNKYKNSVISESNDSNLDLEMNDTYKENHEIEECVHAELILTYDQRKTDKQEENSKEQNINFYPDNKNHKCKFCEDVFFIYDSLLTHIKRKHSSNIDKIIEMEPIFNENFHLSENITSVHGVQKRHKCDYCELSFFEYPNLKTHIKRNHTIKEFKSFLTRTLPERKKRRKNRGWGNITKSKST